MPITLELHQFRLPNFESIVHQALEFFRNTPLQPLPPDEAFFGGGVYAIYLLAHEGVYRAHSDQSATRPIYVGKAVPIGWRTARTRELSRSLRLYARLREHARSISQTADLLLSQFRTRFMVLDGMETDLIVPVEAELIRLFKPLWNTTIDGFGNHDPGSGRYEQSLSEWDTLHPGRSWAAKLTGSKPDIQAILLKIQQHLDERNL